MKNLARNSNFSVALFLMRANEDTLAFPFPHLLLKLEILHIIPLIFLPSHTFQGKYVDA